MRIRLKNGREKRGLGTGTGRVLKLGGVMRGGELEQATPCRSDPGGRAIDAVGAPLLGCRRVARKDRPMPMRPREVAQSCEARLPLGFVQMIVAEHEAAAAWQLGEHRFEPRIVARIGKQPELRQRIGCLGHRGAIARITMTQTPLEQVEAEIARAAKIARRNPEEITLVAISKTHPAERIEPLLAVGQRHFGENRVQEAQGKWPELREAYPDTVLHMVGQLQSNKAEDAVALFDAIHSLDRASLLKALARAMDRAGRQVPCFVQVDIGEEDQKGGCPVGELPAFLASARDMDVPVAGLMCLPPADIEPAPFFALLAKLADDNGLDGLSMGMSGDYPIAIMQGATHIRVGSALFGERSGAGGI